MSTENFVGVDVSKDKLDVAVYPTNQLFTVENNQNGLDQLAQSLGDLQPQLIVFESTGGYELLAVSTLYAAGLPVVSTAVGDIPSIVVDGKTGILIPPGEPEVLAKALVRLSKNPYERSQMGRAGNKLICSRYNLVDVAKRTIEVYNSEYLNLTKV